MRNREVMSADVVTARPDTSFQELVSLMLRHEISGVPVVDADGLLVGIVTEADLVSKEAFGGRRRRVLELIADLVAGGEVRWANKARGRDASQIMSRRVVTGRVGDRIEVAARTMLEAGVKRLPILDADGRLAGIVSRTDLLKLLDRSDEELSAAISARLASPLLAPERANVRAAVDRGIVTLEGTVEFPHDMTVVRSLVWGVPGVVDVHNHTTARRPEPRMSEL